MGFTWLVALISVFLINYTQANFYKSQLENAASKALGLQARISGKFTISIFPGLHINIKAVSLRNHNREVATLSDTNLHIAILPLFHKEVQATCACREIKASGFAFSNVEFHLKAKDGIIVVKPARIHLYKGEGSANIRADLSGAAPEYIIHFSLSKFRVEEYIKTKFPKNVASGSMDLTTNLTMQGNSETELKQSASGDISLRGENITFYGRDLDKEFSRYESSQNFNLFDAGAYFFLGPLGLAVTKGYNFTKAYQDTEGKSAIGVLCSDWKVEKGAAYSGDVAMATQHHRLALKGSLDLVNERFNNVTIALIDPKGRAIVKQEISGPFMEPVVKKPAFLMSLAGPAINLAKRGENFVIGNRSKVFYAGSVPPPK